MVLSVCRSLSRWLSCFEVSEFDLHQHFSQLHSIAWISVCTLLCRHADSPPTIQVCGDSCSRVNSTSEIARHCLVVAQCHYHRLILPFLFFQDMCRVVFSGGIQLNMGKPWSTSDKSGSADDTPGHTCKQSCTVIGWVTHR